MIEIYIPEKFIWAKKYSIECIFKKRFGIDVMVKLHEKDYYLIYQRLNNKSIKLPDVFFKNESNKWLKKRTNFDLNIKQFNLQKDIQVKGFGDKLYSIFHIGDSNVIKFNNEKKSNYLPIDIFGALFFMFSSYEEYCLEQRDSHSRFTENHSCITDKIYSIPIIDIYIELLWKFCHKSFSNLKRKFLKAAIRVTCDIDHPYSQKTFFIKTKNVIKKLLKKQKYKYQTKILKKIISEENLDKFDTDYAGIKYILKKNKEIGNKVVFYSIPYQTSWRYDTNLDWKNLRTRSILKEILENGNQLGIHPGYNTCNNLRNFKKTLEFAKNHWPDEKQIPNYILNRQHYLRWDVRTTPEILNKLNISEDSSLGFSRLPGFRNGTCFPFLLVDLNNETITNVIEIPLILMESSVFSKNARNLNDPDLAYQFMNELKIKCFNVGGIFTLLWHNSNFTKDFHHEIYENLIK